MRMLSTKRSAIAAAGGFSVIAAFQLALALNAPFGRAAGAAATPPCPQAILAVLSTKVARSPRLGERSAGGFDGRPGRGSGRVLDR